MSRPVLELQQGIIYGPINSRRLGSSLGINILPTEYKACSFNCAYCQYGFTTKRGYTCASDGCDLPTAVEIIETLEDALEEFPSVSYITFSGNGEPTLHPDFGMIVDEVNRLKSRLAPGAKSAILSNSTLVIRRDVRQALGRLDRRFMKLDAGDERTFRRYSRPHKDIKFDKVVAGLKMMDDVMIQTLFAGGKAGNYNDTSVEKWIETIGEISPIECHIYSLERPFPDRSLTMIDREGLLKVKERTESQVNIPVDVFVRE